MGRSYGFPFFVHSGVNSTYPERCECSKRGKEDSCDQFSFFAGLAVYDYTSNTTAIHNFSKDVQPFLPILELFYVPFPYLVSVEVIIIAFFPHNPHDFLTRLCVIFRSKEWK
jgi:hypothetical protein